MSATGQGAPEASGPAKGGNTPQSRQGGTATARQGGNWQAWIKGLAAAGIGGASSSVTVVLADPDHFNFSAGLKKLGAVAAIGALVAVAAYLQKSPLPVAVDPRGEPQA